MVGKWPSYDLHHMHQILFDPAKAQTCVSTYIDIKWRRSIQFSRRRSTCFRLAVFVECVGSN